MALTKAKDTDACVLAFLQQKSFVAFGLTSLNAFNFCKQTSFRIIGNNLDDFLKFYGYHMEEVKKFYKYDLSQIYLLKQYSLAISSVLTKKFNQYEAILNYFDFDEKFSSKWWDRHNQNKLKAICINDMNNNNKNNDSSTLSQIKTPWKYLPEPNNCIYIITAVYFLPQWQKFICYGDTFTDQFFERLWDRSKLKHGDIVDCRCLRLGIRYNEV